MEERRILDRRLFVGTFTLTFALGACANPKPASSLQATPAPAASATNPAVRVIGHGRAGRRVAISEFTHNRLVYRIYADSSVYDSRTHDATFARADGTFFGANGQARLRMAAPVAVVDQQTKSVVMSGGVHAWTAAGTDLRCDRLRYDDTSGRLYGTGGVRLAKDDDVVTGERIDADLRLERYTVFGS